MPDALQFAGTFVLLLLAIGAPLWTARSAIRPWHLAALLAAVGVLAATTMALRTVIILALPAGLVTALLGGALVLATVFMLVARAYPAKEPDDVHRGHAVRYGATDHSRSYAGPQIAALLAAGWMAKAGLHLIALPVAAFFAALSWIAAQRRLRLIRNTPTSRIASAAQGFVELHGHGRPIGEQPLASPLRRKPCIWFRYRIEEKRGRNWRTVETATSDEPFVLDDGSGTAVVEPAGALVHTSNKLVWRDGRRRYTEEWLYPRDRLHLLGDFASENPVAQKLDARKDTGDLLAEWKRDPAALKTRFDADGDGEISLAEWQVAQKQATQQVAAQHAEVRAMPATHVVRAPDSRPFMISAGAEADVTSKARRSALLRMGWFALLLGGSSYAAVNGAGKTRQRRQGAARPRQ